MKSSSSRGNVTGTRSELLDHAPAFNTLMFTRSEEICTYVHKYKMINNNWKIYLCMRRDFSRGAFCPPKLCLNDEIYFNIIKVLPPLYF